MIGKRALGVKEKPAKPVYRDRAGHSDFMSGMFLREAFAGLSRENDGRPIENPSNRV
jgi:hypothetical protein